MIDARSKWFGKQASDSGRGNVCLEPDLTTSAFAVMVRFFQFGDWCDATEKMQGVILTGHGGPEMLEWRDDIAVPVPGKGDVVIRVAAAGVITPTSIPAPPGIRRAMRTLMTQHGPERLWFFRVFKALMSAAGSLPLARVWKTPALVNGS